MLPYDGNVPLPHSTAVYKYLMSSTCQASVVHSVKFFTTLGMHGILNDHSYYGLFMSDVMNKREIQMKEQLKNNTIGLGNFWLVAC